MSRLARLLLICLCAFEPVSARVIRRQLFTPYPDPNDDPFYAQPSDISSDHPGQVLATRPVDLVLTGLQLTTQIKYVTTDNNNKTVSTVGTLFEPLTPRVPPVLLSYQFAEDSLNLACSPSWAYVPFSGSPQTSSPYSEGVQVLSWAMSNGYHVIMPDALGPNSTWLVGRMEGQATLDGIRAAMNHLSLDAGDTKVALYGYSGAARTTLWAETLSMSYAPELNVVGSAHGGTPIDLTAAYKYIDATIASVLAGGMWFGLAAGYPALQTEFQTGAGALTAAGKAAQEKMTSDGYCLPEHVLDYAYVEWNTYYQIPPLQNPVVQQVLARETLLANESSFEVPVPTFPRLMYHAVDDEIVPYAQAAEYVEQQCDRGANLQFKSVPLLDHFTANQLDFPVASTFLQQAIEGTVPSCKCGSLCISA